MAKLHLSQDLVDQMRAHCRAAAPSEGCGLLLGEVREGKRRVRRVHGARNAHGARPNERYLVHPEDFVAADATASAEGIEILGVFHSHPDGAAEPSPEDLAQAQPGWSYVIVSLGASAAERSFVLAAVESGRRFEEERLCVC